MCLLPRNTTIAAYFAVLAEPILLFRPVHRLIVSNLNRPWMYITTWNPSTKLGRAQ